MEQITRIELALSAWEADVLPLNYTCIFSFTVCVLNLTELIILHSNLVTVGWTIRTSPSEDFATPQIINCISVLFNIYQRCYWYQPLPDIAYSDNRP